jgi:hypothetical protein
MPEIVEHYRRIGDPEDRFDLDFWQKQGAEAIFRAALELIRDAQLVKHGHADEPRLQRTTENFQKR